jgi:hypothetical protein
MFHACVQRFDAAQTFFWLILPIKQALRRGNYGIFNQLQHCKKKKELLLVYVLLKCSTCSLQKMGIFARKAVPFVLHIEPRRVVVSHVKKLQMPSPERYPPP